MAINNILPQPFPKPNKRGFHKANSPKFCEGCKKVLDPRIYKNHIDKGLCTGKRKYRTLEEIEADMRGLIGA